MSGCSFDGMPAPANPECGVGVAMQNALAGFKAAVE